MNSKHHENDTKNNVMTTVINIVRSVRPRTLQPPSLQSLSLQQNKDNSNIAADIVPSVLEWI